MTKISLPKPSTWSQLLKASARILSWSRKLLLALLKAEEFAKQHPAEAQKSVADFRGTPQVLLSKLWADNTFIVSLDQSLVLALEDESRWAIKNGLTSARKVPNYLDFIYLDGLLSIKPKAVRILR